MPAVAHLTTGSTNPPLVDGKLRLYSMRFCPFAQRVHLVLNAKNVPYDVVYINLITKPDWYTKRFPTGKVPALVFNGTDLYESLIISDFLNENYPDNPLFPSDPVKKAKDRLVIENVGKVHSAMYKMYFAQTIDKSIIDDLFKGLDEYESELSSRGTSFFGGESAKMVDYMIWPWFERLGIIPILAGPEFKLPEKRFAHLIKWIKSMEEDKAVKECFLKPEQHAHHIKMRKEGTPDYVVI